MNRIELKNRARENVRKDKFTIILITLVATAIMSAAALTDLSFPVGWLEGGSFLTVAPETSVTSTQTAKNGEFDLDDFFDDDGEFDTDYYFGNGESQKPSTPFQNPYADNGGYDDDYYYDYDDSFFGNISVGNAGLALAVFLLSGALTAGLLWYHLKIWRGEEGDIRDLFSKFNKDFPRITKMYLLQTLYVFLWSLLLIVPGIIMAIAYSQAYYLMLDDPELGATEALNLSKQLMKGKKWDYFVMYLSFIGWFLLGILTLGILFLWIDPYLLQTLTGYYDEVIKPARVAAETTASQNGYVPESPDAAENKTPGEPDGRLRPGE